MERNIMGDLQAIQHTCGAMLLALETHDSALCRAVLAKL
jgi:hypothetical protein